MGRAEASPSENHINPIFMKLNLSDGEDGKRVKATLLFLSEERRHPRLIRGRASVERA